MRVLAIAVLSSLFANTACSSGPETPEACIDRFSEGAEIIDFFDNDIFGATYTYEIYDFESVSDVYQDEGSFPGALFRIDNGHAYLTVHKSVPAEKRAVAFGCKSAPPNSRLIRIERGRPPSPLDS